MPIGNLTAGEVSHKLKKDTTKYNAREVGHAMVDVIGPHLRTTIEKYKPMIDEAEFCVVMLIGEDALIKGVKRRKFYCWPYLPKPRPNQSVFLYDRAKDDLTKRLWILPSDMVMAELTSLPTVDKRYANLKKWSEWFFHGWRFYADPKDPKNMDKGRWINTTPSYFYQKIREEHSITLESEHEYALSHRDELMQAGCKIPESFDPEPFDFSKIAIKQVIDTNAIGIQQDGLHSLGQA